MIDEYLLRHITDFLKLCKRCNRYDTCNKDKLCCICGDFFCTDCKTNLITIYGFFKVNIVNIATIGTIGNNQHF